MSSFSRCMLADFFFLKYSNTAMYPGFAGRAIKEVGFVLRFTLGFARVFSLVKVIFPIVYLLPSLTPLS